LKFGYNQSEKWTLGCARTLSEVNSGVVLPSIGLTGTALVWRSIRIPAVAISREPHI